MPKLSTSARGKLAVTARSAASGLVLVRRRHPRLHLLAELGEPLPLLLQPLVAAAGAGVLLGERDRKIADGMDAEIARQLGGGTAPSGRA
ncbi:hypothetical protein Kpho02_10730 [Kitasatospora phosalacinea]|uniref:Uncharacterized protein n=1 Tax=Kitasatospora phosalacinea TaxID=2065 RepID=A0A9W6Q2L5_9ACTN|nr:hypothetical protein Kpho02_10730 [Kitasatospora phosalacinea]